MSTLSLSNQGFEFVYYGSGGAATWNGSVFVGDVDDSAAYDYYLDGTGTSMTMMFDNPDTDPAALDGAGYYTYLPDVTVDATTTDAVLVNDGNHYWLLSNVAQTSFPLAMTPYDGSNSQFTGPTTPCFARGTLIATPEGECAVEALVIGDLVVNACGEWVPVRWIGHKTRHVRFAAREGSLPVCIKAGALDGVLPRRDLYVSPDHAMLVDGLLVHALALVNGVSVVQMQEWRDANVEYYHIELENHELILAEGAPTETFVDNVSRKSFDNYAEYAKLYGEGSPIPELPLPRVKTRRQLPNQTKGRLMRVAMKGACSAA